MAAQKTSDAGGGSGDSRQGSEDLARALIAAIEAAAGDKKGGKDGKDRKAGEQEEEAK